MTTTGMKVRTQETVESIQRRCRLKPCLGLIFGSGLAPIAESFNDHVTIPFRDIPYFPIPTVPGHPGNLILGRIGGVAAAALQGRVHVYEGYSMEQVAYPARILGCLGIKQLIVTNAAGGINSAFRPGDLMLITDHINLMGANPLEGPNLDELGPRFPDMSEAYHSRFRNAALEAGRETGISLRQGIYAGLRGPSYETPAEIRMCRTIGADAAGMSSIPEVIVANHMGIGVLGISCIANMAAGILPRKLSHREVLECAAMMKDAVASLINAVIPKLLVADHQ
ncbi:MAG: purine-nucleoside phosphorylase [Acidobacteria bacterium]|nr:purine-nucleoside phosphorylase [Acidobacteriota bacterium]